jgi:2-amino-4-hydroxy-6-hydroxymethyldihydropteridine diphosphokinase
VYASTDAAGGDAVYLNAAAIVETTLDAAALKTEVLRPLESALGRERGGAAVTADADIVLFNREVTSYLGRDLPDPDVTTRAHVALPLADIAPDYVHPVSGQTLAQIAAALRSPAIHRREDIRL